MMPDHSEGAEQVRDLLAESERLKVENLLLKQKAEFDLEFKKHVEDVESRITRGKFQLGLAGVVALCLAWYGAYHELKDKVQQRLDKEFGSKEIQVLISRSADKEAREIIRARLSEYKDAESDKLKCLIASQGKDMFLLQCRAAGGEIDFTRNVCTNTNRGELRYESPYPKLDCDKILQATSGVTDEDSRR